MTVAAIYARKSKITEKGDSIENQIKLCKQHLNSLYIEGLDNILVYSDEGFSGKNVERPQFQKMLEDAKQNKFNILACYKLDRISRSVADFSNFVTDLQKLGISFISLNEKFDTSTAMGMAMMYICSVFAQLERETISMRIRDNMYALAEKGNWLGGEEPTGYKNKRISYLDSNGKEKTYSILEQDDSEVQLVILIYSKYLELKSLSKVEKYMLTNNIKTKNGNDWSKTSLKSILANPVYVRADDEVFNYYKSQNITINGIPDGIHGLLIYNKRLGKAGKNRDYHEWVYSVADHEGIINSDPWLEVQRLLSINKNKIPALGSSHTALLSGMLRCAKCGSYMRVAYGKQYSDKGIKKFYYVCSLKNNSGKTRCDNRNVDGPELDSIIVDKLKEMSIDTNVLLSELKRYKSEIESSEENVELRHLNQSLKQNTTMVGNLITNISLTPDKETAELILKRISELKEENKQIEKRLKELEDTELEQSKAIKDYDTFIKLIKEFALIIDSASLKDKRELISSVVDKVYVDGDTGNVRIKFLGVDEL